MSDARTKALNTVRYLRLAPETIQGLRKEKRLSVEAPPNWPPELVAQYAVRVALENECTTIRVTQGRHTVREFDVMALCTLTRTLTGGTLPRPKLRFVPQRLATMGFKRLGADLMPFKAESQIAVPSNLPLSSRAGR